MATKVTNLLIDYARNVINLESLYVEVNFQNIAAIKVYERNGFIAVDKSEAMIKMTRLLRTIYQNNITDI